MAGGRAAFPSETLDAHAATVSAVPFLMDPVTALRGEGRIPHRITGRFIRLVAAYVFGVATRVCGEAAVLLADEAIRGLGLPADSRVLSAVQPVRSGGTDAVAAGCSLVGGVCVCYVSAPRGAEADALSVMA